MKAPKQGRAAANTRCQPKRRRQTGRVRRASAREARDECELDRNDEAHCSYQRRAEGDGRYDSLFFFSFSSSCFVFISIHPIDDQCNCLFSDIAKLTHGSKTIPCFTSVAPCLYLMHLTIATLLPGSHYLVRAASVHQSLQLSCAMLRDVYKSRELQTCFAHCSIHKTQTERSSISQRYTVSSTCEVIAIFKFRHQRTM